MFFGEWFAVNDQAFDAAVGAFGIPNVNLILDALKIQLDGELRPVSWNARLDNKVVATNLKPEDMLDSDPVEPAARARVPAPTPTSKMLWVCIDITASNVGFGFISIDCLWSLGMRNRVDEIEQLKGQISVSEIARGKHRPSRGMGILSAVFSQPWRITLDIARIRDAFFKWWPEQLYQTVLAIDEASIHLSKRFALTLGLAEP